MITRERPTLLVDEGDNLDLANTPDLRAVINSGHHRDGQICRATGTFYTFAPLAMAAIGLLSLPFMHRSVVIAMERSPVILSRFDPHTIVFDWARGCTLDTDPEMPAALRNRVADNWRPLISIADACGAGWGERARKAAIVLSDDQEEDIGVILLTDIRNGSDRLASAVIVNELNELPDAPWSAAPLFAGHMVRGLMPKVRSICAS
jgi:Protein of unknown function (DUF3631)